MLSPLPPPERRARRRWSIYAYISRGVAWLASVIPQLPWEVKLDARLKRTARGAAPQTLTHKELAGDQDLASHSDESGDLYEALADLDEVKLPPPLPQRDDYETPDQVSADDYPAIRPPEFDALTSDIAGGDLEPSPTPLDLEYTQDPDLVPEQPREAHTERFTSSDIQRGDSPAQGTPHRPPRGAQRIKLRDPDKRSKKRRKKSSRRTKQDRRNSSSPQLSQATPEAAQLSPNLTRPSHEPHPEPELEYSKRPPLRSASRWRALGDAELNRWQQYSPSSKSLLFGSWLASLERLVEVQDLAQKDREQFFSMVADHESLNSLSQTELDAWWFQLNRVDHFITEYQLLKRAELSPLMVFNSKAQLSTRPQTSSLVTQHPPPTQDSVYDTSSPRGEDLPPRTSHVDHRKGQSAQEQLAPEPNTFKRTPQVARRDPSPPEELSSASQRTPVAPIPSEREQQVAPASSSQEISDVILRPVRSRRKSRRRRQDKQRQGFTASGHTLDLTESLSRSSTKGEELP